jgi:FkbM family methyltransferase
VYVGDTVRIIRDGRVVVISRSHLAYTEEVATHFDTYWGAVVGRDGVVDYSRPAKHTYRHNGLEFWFPWAPEEPDAVEAYYHWGPPQPGDVVFDIGAYAGVSAYHFSQAVGPSGRVFAFEPDPVAFQYLERNLRDHRLDNVVAIQKGIAGVTGTRLFNAEAALGAAFSDLVNRGGAVPAVGVECLSLADACAHCGTLPKFVKIDVEGAEIEIIAGARDLLKTLKATFAIDSSHPPHGRLVRPGETTTAPALERLFLAAGYEVHSNDTYRLMTTWARLPNR